MEVLGIIGIIALIVIIYVIGGLLGWGLKGIGEIFSFLVKAGAHALTLSYGSCLHFLRSLFFLRLFISIEEVQQVAVRES